MSYLLNMSIKAKNYKCFGKNPQGFNEIYPLNIIIGRNNSGKSALIDLIKYAVSPYDILNFGHKQNQPQVFITKSLTDAEIKGVFPPLTHGGRIQGDHFQYGKKWIGKPITFELQLKNIKIFENVNPPFSSNKIKPLFEKLATIVENPLSNKVFKRLLSDRDIGPELDGSQGLQENGQGATNIIQQFINKDHLDRSLVDDKLLNALNKIFEPDSSFTSILVRQLSNDKWEIFLEEENKGRIALSSSGSGLKTIILVLINFILMPVIENKNLDQYIFAFEELENNMHPALQRRLLNYIHDIAINEKCCIFLSTHSNVIIDLFSKNKAVQIIHVKHNGKYAQVNLVQTYSDNKGILDDLDVRASDLLQSNSIIWVEGPSDRIYFNRWIELWSDGKLREGTHYQCVFYGGRLLAHLDATEPEIARGLSILNVNRNAIILIDSDKKYPQTPLNNTKKRVISEIEKNRGFAWVTAGKEIENYIPLDALKQHYGNNNLVEFNKYTVFSEYLNKVKKGEGDKFMRSKVLFTEKITPHLTKEMLEETLDLKEKLTEVCKMLDRWNNL